MTDESLHEALRREAAAFPGVLGVAARRLPDGPAVALNAAETFTAASVIKLPILIEALRQVDAGELDLGARTPLPAAELVAGSGVLQHLDPELPLTLKDYLTLMTIVSDNTATNVTLDLVGGVDRVNLSLTEWGLGGTEIVAKLMLPPQRRTAAQLAGKRNVTTPRDMDALLARLWAGELLSPARTALALEILSRQVYNDAIPRRLPPGTWAAHKTGEVVGTRNDVGLVRHGDAVMSVAVMTGGVRDERYWADNEGTLLIGRVTRLLFDRLLA